MQGHIPTGVDRICLAYVQAVWEFGSGRATPGKVRRGAFTSRLARAVLTPARTGKQFFPPRVGLIAKSPPMPLPKHKSAGRFLFNVGHSGLERPSVRTVACPQEGAADNHGT